MAGVKTAAVSLLSVLVLLPAPSAPAAHVAYSIDPQQSKIEIQVGREAPSPGQFFTEPTIQSG